MRSYALAIALVVLAGCGGSNTQANVAGNTRADAAHLAVQANEPRAADPTAAQPTGMLPTTGTAPKPTAPAATPAATPANEPTSATTAAPPVAAPSQGWEAPAEPKRISARHVLVQWMGSDRAGKSVLRTREQALVLAQEVLRRAKAGDDLGRLAVEYSDEPNAGPRGGSLGRFNKGQMVGAFDAVAFKLKVGQISDIVETPFGYHIIQRTE